VTRLIHHDFHLEGPASTEFARNPVERLGI